MNKEQIARAINQEHPSVYAPTNEPTKLVFKDGTMKVGYFQHTKDYMELEKENKYTFVEFGENANAYRQTQDDKYLTIINGDDLSKVEYPAS